MFPSYFILSLFIQKTTDLFTRLDRVQPGPSRVSDGPFSAENVIHEDFVLIGELRLSFSALLQGRKRNVETSPFFILSAS